MTLHFWSEVKKIMFTDLIMPLGGNAAVDSTVDVSAY